MKAKSKATLLLEIKRRIEKLRGEMVSKFVQSGADIRDPQVLRLSQQLDEQLNRYDRCRSALKRGRADMRAIQQGRLKHYA